MLFEYDDAAIDYLSRKDARLLAARDGDVGFNEKFYTFPYFLTFLLKRWLKER